MDDESPMTSRDANERLASNDCTTTSHHTNLDGHATPGRKGERRGRDRSEHGDRVRSSQLSYMAVVSGELCCNETCPATPTRSPPVQLHLLCVCQFSASPCDTQ